MKKYFVAVLALITVLSLASCEDDMIERDGRRMADDVRDGIRDAERHTGRAVDDFTDGAVTDSAPGYNVDDYNPYGPEAK